MVDTGRRQHGAIRCARSPTTTQSWARAIYSEDGGIDGILYPSAMRGQPAGLVPTGVHPDLYCQNVALFERARPSLPSRPRLHLSLAHPGLASTLGSLATDYGYDLMSLARCYLTQQVSGILPIIAPQMSPWKCRVLPHTEFATSPCELTEQPRAGHNHRHGVPTTDRRCRADRVAARRGRRAHRGSPCVRQDRDRAPGGRSEVLLDLDEQARALAAIDPALLLDGDTPRLIDESPADRRRYLGPGPTRPSMPAVPRTRRPGSGSSSSRVRRSPLTTSPATSARGRFVRLRMRPMTLAEAGTRPAWFSLASVLDGADVRATDPCRPRLRPAARAALHRRLAGQISTPAPRPTTRSGCSGATWSDVARVDVRRVDGARRDPRLVERPSRRLPATSRRRRLSPASAVT